MPGHAPAGHHARTASLWLLLATYLVVSVLWAVAVPPFEKPDEIHHLAYIQFLTRERRLPVQAKEAEAFLDGEIQQPPLYYLGASATYQVARSLGVRQTDLSGWHSRVNPRFAGKDPSPDADASFWLHGPVDGSPDTQPPTDLLVPRLLSLVIGLAVVLITYRTGLIALDGEHWLALAAAGLVAFLPQFTFLASSASNDPLSWAVSAGYVLALLIVLEASPSEARRYYLGLGVLMGVALLTKATLLCLVPLIFLAKPRALSRGQWLRGLALWAAAALAIGGWWFARSAALYGDVLGRHEMVSPARYAWNLAPKSLFSPYFRGLFPARVGQSFVGTFGFMSIRLPALAYAVAAGAGLAALAGLLRYVGRLGRTRDGSEARLQVQRLVVLGAVPLLAMAALIYYNLSVDQPQGRYLFPALSALAVLFVLGLDELVGAVRRVDPADGEAHARNIHRPWLAIAVVGLMLALNLYALFVVALPPYGGAAWALLPGR